MFQNRERYVKYQQWRQCDKHPLQKATERCWFEWNCHVRNVSESAAGKREERAHLFSLCWGSETRSRERKANQEQLDKGISVFMYTSVSDLNYLSLMVWVCMCVSVCTRESVCLIVKSICQCLCVLWEHVNQQSHPQRQQGAVCKLLSLPAVSYQPGRG